jgi:NADH:ubiquinone oxidoreductase subunit 5 (subunit L)/multisubunit Na+/H+ antiporter MnhA subunit
VHTYEMPVLGGLRKKMPITAYTMLAATMAISGVPLFSGFYSKDAILANSLYRVMQSPQHILLFVLPCVGAAMTAFYMFRLWFLTFDGEPRGYPEPIAVAGEDLGHEEDHAHAPAHAHGHGAHHATNPVEPAHESPRIMTWPLIALAIPTIAIGWPWLILPLSEPVLEQMLAYGQPIRAIELGSAHWLAMGASILVATAGIGGAVGYYSRWRLYDPKYAVQRFGGLYKFLVNKWYFDEMYDVLFVRPTLALARGSSGFDRWVIDGVVNGSAYLTVLLSRLEGAFDHRGVDWVVNAVARVVYVSGDWGRGIQTGRVRNYLMFLAVALVGLFAGMFVWIQS